jgi:hypothetical protein
VLDVKDDYIRRLVMTRLQAMPPDVSISIGSYGEFTRDQLIESVKNDNAVGKIAVDMELQFLREMPKLAEKLVR